MRPSSFHRLLCPEAARRRRAGWALRTTGWALRTNRLILLAVAVLAGCGGAAASVSPSLTGRARSPDSAGRVASPPSTAGNPTSSTTGPAAPAAPAGSASGAGPAAAAAKRVKAYPVLHGFGMPSPAWRVVVTVRGHPAVWISTRYGVTLLRIDQHRARLALHAGSLDPGGGPWRYGDAIVGRERRRLVAAFNGGFRLNTHSGGWRSYGRTPVPLTNGLASIVTYRSGMTDIGAWHHGVPSGRPIASVRQNLHLLVDGGVAAGNLESCLKACWGATLGGRPSVARAAIAVTAGNLLIWAGASSATPATLARALIAGGADRAAELDINPSWVAGYLYYHGGGPLAALPVVPGQLGVPGHFLTPYTRDFFSLIER